MSYRAKCARRHELTQRRQEPSIVRYTGIRCGEHDWATKATRTITLSPEMTANLETLWAGMWKAVGIEPLPAKA